MSWQTIIPIVISILALSYTVFRGTREEKRVDTSEIESRAAENARINYKLDESIRIGKESVAELRTLRKELSAQDGRLIAVEREVRSLEKRVDNMELRLSNLTGSIND